MSERPTTQFSTRVDAELLADFARVCKDQGESQREVVERLMEAHVAHKESRHTLHLDGRVCPLSECLNSIRDLVARDMEAAATEAGTKAIHALASKPRNGQQ